MWRLIAPALTVLALGACGGDVNGGGGPTGTSGSATPSALSSGTGPSSAHVSISGDAGLAGNRTVNSNSIQCGYPQIGGGLGINVGGKPPGAGMYVEIQVTKASLVVNLSYVSGSTFFVRRFQGPVAAFDGLRGAAFDAPLTALPQPATLHAGNLGALTRIAGAVDCGGARPGSSTLVISGTALAHALNGGLEPVRVECQHVSAGDQVAIAGNVAAGGTTALVFIVVSHTVVNSVVDAATVSEPFALSGGGAHTLNADGAHLDVSLNGRGSDTIHIAGDATCGVHTSF
jgi:hypothetical protein